MVEAHATKCSQMQHNIGLINRMDLNFVAISMGSVRIVFVEFRLSSRVT